MTTQKISDEARKIVAEIAPVIIWQLKRINDICVFSDKHEIVSEHVQKALDAARDKALEDAARLLETKVVNLNGVTNGKSGSLIDCPIPLRDTATGTYADAIRAMKVAK